MEIMINKKKLIFIFFFLITTLVYTQNEKVIVDSSGIIIVKEENEKYLDQSVWSCIINDENQNFIASKQIKNNQKTITFLYPNDFTNSSINTGYYNVTLKKNEKIIYNNQLYFNLNPKGKYKLYSYPLKINMKEIRGEIIDVYYFESELKKHIIIRSLSQEKRIYFYYLIDKTIINVHTDLFNIISLSSIINPIIITDLNNDNSPEVTFKYKSNSHDKIVLFNTSEKFICRKYKEEINYSDALNVIKNIFFKQHLLNEITKISE